MDEIEEIEYSTFLFFNKENKLTEYTGTGLLGLDLNFNLLDYEEFFPLIKQIVAYDNLIVNFKYHKNIHNCYIEKTELFSTGKRIQLSAISDCYYNPLHNIQIELLNQLPVDVALFDSAARYVYVNHHAVKNPERRQFLIGKTNAEAYNSDNSRKIESNKRDQMVLNALKENKVIGFEEVVKVEGQEDKYFYRVIKPISLHGLPDKYVVGYGLDISELTKTNILNRNLVKIINETDTAFSVSDNYGNLVYANESYKKLYNLNSSINEGIQQIKGQDGFQLSYSHKPQISNEALRVIGSSLELASVPMLLLKKDGSVQFVNARFNLFFNVNILPGNYLTIQKDSSENWKKFVSHIHNQISNFKADQQLFETYETRSTIDEKSSVDIHYIANNAKLESIFLIVNDFKTFEQSFKIDRLSKSSVTKNDELKNHFRNEISHHINTSLLIIQMQASIMKIKSGNGENSNIIETIELEIDKIKAQIESLNTL